MMMKCQGNAKTRQTGPCVPVRVRLGKPAVRNYCMTTLGAHQLRTTYACLRETTCQVVNHPVTAHCTYTPQHAISSKIMVIFYSLSLANCTTHWQVLGRFKFRFVWYTIPEQALSLKVTVMSCIYDTVQCTSHWEALNIIDRTWSFHGVCRLT
jgi:hypothetical protein